MDTLTLLNDTILFFLGLIVGSFLNVCILRIPNGESVVHTPSHCFSCHTRLRWFELIPLFSFLFLGGRCAHCHAKISVQYPLIELGNALLWLLIFHRFGLSLLTPLACLLTSALLVLSVIDSRILEIPPGTTIFILVLGGFRLCSDLSHWRSYCIGFFAVSIPLLLLYLITHGNGIGGGDVKLMAACGLFLGWQQVFVALFLGCALGSLIHLVRMKFFHADRVLAMGPYLALGVFLSLLFGPQLLSWYLMQFTIDSVQLTALLFHCQL